MTAKASSVVAGVQADLGGLRDKRLAVSALAQSALVLAAQLDDPETSATAKANCARILLETLDRLRALQPPAREKDGLDELSAKRATRIRRASS